MTGRGGGARERSRCPEGSRRALPPLARPGSRRSRRGRSLRAERSQAGAAAPPAGRGRARRRPRALLLLLLTPGTRRGVRSCRHRRAKRGVSAPFVSALRGSNQQMSFPLLEADARELIISGVLKTSFAIPWCFNKPQIL